MPEKRAPAALATVDQMEEAREPRQEEEWFAGMRAIVQYLERALLMDPRASESQQEDAERRLRENVPLQLAAAAFVGDADCMKDSMAGPHIDARHGGGMTPLIIAAIMGRPAPIRWLLARGADASLVDEAGRTALAWAERAGNPRAAQALRAFHDEG